MKHIIYRYLLLTVFCLTFLPLSCAPGRYSKPVTTFQESTQKSKEMYFNQLKDAHNSYTEAVQLDFKLDILLMENYNYGSKRYQRTKERLLEMANSKSIPEKTLELRIRAFKVLEFYGKTLHTLSTDEKTDTLISEFKGLSTDIEKFLKTTEGLSELSSSLGFLKSASEWAGPLSSAVGVIEKIIGYVSNYYRERTIKKAIIDAHPKITELVSLLREEVGKANAKINENYGTMNEDCERALKENTNSSSAALYLAHNLCRKIEIEQNKQMPSIELKEAFTLVIKSHSEMERLAKGGDFDAIIEEIWKFEQRLDEIKTKFDLLLN